ncbi:hypothetical protein [Allofrancisella frigidaquae]|uniref:Uncharacterized protein n=1 Tax=Allofrancisella frigidaquae TaxID=1085644 RepID=A0A6M3HT75_9GAMM|nr:hypothetical protein [Allofrancisella frigidaquae]QIV94349.1 hypothetical protein E3E15_02840 [Allofrancisella frigidaquae]
MGKPINGTNSQLNPELQKIFGVAPGELQRKYNDAMQNQNISMGTSLTNPITGHRKWEKPVNGTNSQLNPELQKIFGVAPGELQRKYNDVMQNQNISMNTSLCMSFEEISSINEEANDILSLLEQIEDLD